MEEQNPEVKTLKALPRVLRYFYVKAKEIEMWLSACLFGRVYSHEIINIKPETIDGCQVYYRIIACKFECFMVINGNLHHFEMTVWPSVLRCLLHLLNPKRPLFAERTIAYITSLMRAGATATIKTVLNKN